MKEAARRRLAASVDRVMGHLIAIADDVTQPPVVRLAAIRDVLDRGGFKPGLDVEVRVAPWEDMLAEIVAEVPGEELYAIPADAGHEDDYADDPAIVDAEIVETPPSLPARPEPLAVEAARAGRVAPPPHIRRGLAADTGSEWSR